MAAIYQQRVLLRQHVVYRFGPMLTVVQGRYARGTRRTREDGRSFRPASFALRRSLTFAFLLATRCHRIARDWDVVVVGRGVMKLASLGRTKILVPQLAFGALPIQRLSVDQAVELVRKAFDGGIRFFDTARAYTDSEEKLGCALSDVRNEIVLASKTTSTDAGGARRDLETSLSRLRTDHLDIIQLHNPDKVPDPEDGNSAYAALVAARREGLVRFIGITNHRNGVARQAVRSGLFDTLQFPLSHISSAEDLSLIEECRLHGVGFIAMKALCGGLLTNVTAAFAFFSQYADVVPIWGLQREEELRQFFEMERNPPELSEKLRREIEEDRLALSTSFCRGCGYCLPCAADIPIPMAARMSFLLRRAPYRPFLTEEWRQKMERIADCTECRSCVDRCPYGLEPPSLLRRMYEDYVRFAADHSG